MVRLTNKDWEALENNVGKDLQVASMTVQRKKFKVYLRMDLVEELAEFNQIQKRDKENE